MKRGEKGRAARAALFRHQPPVVFGNGKCMRCGGSPLVVVYNDDPESVGAGAHALLCGELCEKRPWICVKCSGVNVPEHARSCEVAHPGYRAKWEADRAGVAGDYLRLATMLALRGEFLPKFLMDMLFDRADPQGEKLSTG